jgi:hypothetical protein
LIVAKSFSMGFKSGEYGGKNKRVAALLAISSWVWGLLWKGALSMTTTCVSFKRGQSWVSSHQVKTAVSHEPSNKIGAAKRVPIRAASREVRGLRCPEVRPYTRAPFRAYA